MKILEYCEFKKICIVYFLRRPIKTKINTPDAISAFEYYKIMQGTDYTVF